MRLSTRSCAKLAPFPGDGRHSPHWLASLARTAGIPRTTFYSWWRTFCIEEGRRRAPSEAREEDRTRFFAWLEVHLAQAQAA